MREYAGASCLHLTWLNSPSPALAAIVRMPRRSSEKSRGFAASAYIRNC
jgi:hypothetical protein